MTAPWRYACHECGSSSLYHRQDSTHRCKVCGEIASKRYDKKLDRHVR